MDPHAAMYRRLLSVFSEEAAERIHRVNAALLALERGDTVQVGEALTGVMRELHTLKGAGGSVNLEDVETLAHDLESVFGPIQRAERTLTPGVLAVAYRTLDAIGELIAAAVEERPAAVDVSALVSQMRAAADGAQVPGVGSPRPSDPSDAEAAATLDTLDEPAGLAPASVTAGDGSDTATEIRTGPAVETGPKGVDEATMDEPTPGSGVDAESEDEEQVGAEASDADDVDREALLRSFADLQHNPFAEFAALSEFGDVEDIADSPVEPGDAGGSDSPDVDVDTEPSLRGPMSQDDPIVDRPDEVVPTEGAEQRDGGSQPLDVDAPRRELEAVPHPRSETEPVAVSAADADAPRAQVLAVFAGESLDRVKTINRRLMTLERDPNADSEAGAASLSEILRELHTLKGSGATVHVEPVEALAHQLEALFGAVRDGARKLDAAVFDIAYRALDAVEGAVGTAVRGDAPVFDEDAWSASIGATLGAEPSTAATSAAISRSHGETSLEVAQPPPEPPPILGGPGAEDTVRVAIAKLDALMGSVSELHVARAAGEQRLSDVRTLLNALSSVEAGWLEADARVRRMLSPSGDAAASVAPPAGVGLDEVLAFLDQARGGLSPIRARLERLLHAMDGDGRRIGQVTDDLQDDVRRTRMMPVSVVFDAFPRLIRDLAVDLGKKAALSIDGAETEVDRAVIEQIRAPLTHLLRNAIDHGLEMPAEREGAGKPAEGTIALSASQRGDTLLIELYDDGAGIDPDTIRTLAVRRGVLSQEAADATNDAEALRLIFRAGFSTREEVTDLSGRGVGLDVVRDAIERLRGSVEVESAIGEWTRFSLVLPLSVASVQCVMVRVAGRPFALPISNVIKIVRLTRDETERADGRLVLPVDGRPVPIASVSEALGLEGAAPLDGTPLPAVLLGSGERRVAFVVDELVGTQTLVLKALPAPFVRLRHISGAAVLGTGEVVGVLNAADLVRTDDPSAAMPAFGGRTASAETDGDGPLVLVVDDSSVTRTMVKGILEAGGFRVQTAADGMQAWEMLRNRSFDLVVSDVNMPEMSGFDLTEKVRSDRFLRGVPVILVTALDSLEDQAHGMDVGADAYITKGSFTDDTLIETVRHFV